jgi:hypothetical protein
MGIEDRLRDDLRQSARTTTHADVLPEDRWQKIQHRIAHRKRGVVVQVETVAVALAASVDHAPVARHRVHWRSRPASTAARLRPEQWQ